ncbi:hypothetical protein [Burkholderia sp. BCC1977]|uniref:hypothetical protein n=1 Tax=Burkholderia sp. BCC1977 TaxID=2817440 RepID=UPI002ABE530A|nr:hypothetical protein [Burkholderia sp. BCC1977]
MADAAYAELYAESRRDGNAGGTDGMRRSGSHGTRAFHYSRVPASIDIFRRITQDITNPSDADRLFIRSLKSKKTVLSGHT